MTNESGMVDVSVKNITLRTAKASSSIVLGAKAFQTLKEGTCVKGDVLATAKVAAITAVKSTPAIIPMCHPILIEAVDVEFKLNKKERSVTTFVTVKSSGKTGVEMEALCATQIALLTIYDMCKAVDRGMVIQSVQLLEKEGGKSGRWQRTHQQC